MRIFLPLLCCMLLLALSGCGSPGRAAAINPGEAKLVMTDFAGRQIAFRDYPSRIVALGSGEADIVAALGGELVGRPSTADEPANAIVRAAEPIGSAHEVDLEKITLLRPDAVLGNDPMNTKDIPVLEGIGTELVLTSADSIADIKRQIALIGRLLRSEAQAEKLIAGIEAKVASYGSVPQDDRPRALLVYGAPGTFLAALPDSLSGDILEVAGGANIAADYPRLQSYPRYAQLNAERVVEANPQMIFIMTHGSPDEVKAGFVREMEANPAWNSVDAVRRQRVEVLPADLFGTNPGTRIGEALDLMNDKLKAVPH